MGELEHLFARTKARRDVAIVCEGACSKNAPRSTSHKFSREFKEYADSGSYLWRKLIYECRECGEERVYGCEE